MEEKSGLIDQYLLEHFLWERNKVKEDLLLEMAVFMKGSLLIICSMVKALTYGLMERNMMEIGSKTKWKVREHLPGQMEENLLGYINKAKDKE